VFFSVLTPEVEFDPFVVVVPEDTVVLLLLLFTVVPDLVERVPTGLGARAPDCP